MNPDSRSRGLTFPDREMGEWAAIIRGPAAGGGICGFGCAPSGASKVAIYSSPIFSGELLYVATYLGKIYAYNAISGAERWIYPRDISNNMGAIVGNMVLAENTLFICSSDGYVYALDKEYGDQKWQYPTGSRIWTAPAYVDGKIYVANYSGKLVALSSDKGNEIWTINLPASSSSSPAIYKEKIIIGTFDHNLYALNQADGSIAWEFKGNNWFWAQVITKGNIIYACSVDDNIYAINGDTGQLVWQYDTGAPIASTPVLVNDNLIVVTETGKLFVLNSADGGYKQSVELGYKVEAPLYVENNVVYAHGTDDYIYAVDSNTAQLLWKFKAETQ
jgi:outer membrane protein assembly factor BamB